MHLKLIIAKRTNLRSLNNKFNNSINNKNKFNWKRKIKYLALNNVTK
jgi:hypothetical protein